MPFLANELVLIIAEHVEDSKDLQHLSHADRRFASLLTPLFVERMIEEDGAEGALFWGIAFRNELIVRTVLRGGNINLVVNQTNVHPPLLPTGTDGRHVEFIMDMNIMLKLHSGQDGSILTPLRWAVENGKLDLVRALIRNGLHVGDTRWGVVMIASRDYRKLWDDALLLAAGIGAEEVAEILLNDSVANIEVEGPGSLRPLHKAVEGRHLGMVRLLLEKRADPLACVYRFAPPYSAIDMAINRYRTSRGAIKERYASIWTPMMRYVSVEFKDTTNKPALVLAAEVGDLDLVEFLLENFADISLPDANGRTALHLAARGGFVDICQLLLDEGADIYAVDHTRRTPLHTAARSHNAAAIQLLVMMGADVAAVDQDLSTPLHMAGRNLFATEDDINALIDGGAPMDVENAQNRTPRDILAAMTTPRIIRGDPVA